MEMIRTDAPANRPGNAAEAPEPSAPDPRDEAERLALLRLLLQDLERLGRTAPRDRDGA